jgi:UDP-2,3-diacylglucosamine hydrolase
MSPSVCFISDAHLGVRTPGWQARDRRIVDFLKRLEPEVSHLVIVGDLFDFWVEYRHLIRWEYFEVLRALSALRERGVEIHYVAGNHDFALGPFISDQLGIRVHPFTMTGEFHGVRLHVQHGDGILASDFMYRILRSVLRSRVNQFLYKLIHPTLGIGIAATASRLSRHGSSGRPLTQARVLAYRAAARALLTQSGAQVVVLGHTHTPEICRGPTGIYCNAGEWLRRRTYATLSEGVIKLWELDGQDRPAEIQPIDW